MILTPQERCFVYQLLARCFKMPVDQPFLDSMANIEIPETDHDYISSWLNLKDISQKQDIEQLDHEFHQLFIGLGRGEVVPYFSWYKTGFLMEKPLAQLRSDLKKLGFKRQETNKEPEDHFSAISEIMAMLIADEREHQNLFFNHYITPWFKQLFNDIQKTRTGDFYPAIADLGEIFIDLEIMNLKNQ